MGNLSHEAVDRTLLDVLDLENGFAMLAWNDEHRAAFVLPLVHFHRGVFVLNDECAFALAGKILAKAAEVVSWKLKAGSWHAGMLLKLGTNEVGRAKSTRYFTTGRRRAFNTLTCFRWCWLACGAAQPSVAVAAGRVTAGESVKGRRPISFPVLPLLAPRDVRRAAPRVTKECRCAT